MRVLVHGAAGFVGRTLVECLVDEKIDELVLTDIRPISEWSGMIAAHRVGEVIMRQVTRLCDLPRPVADVVVVLAGQTNVDEGLEHPMRSFQTNIDIAIDAAEWIRDEPDCRLIYLSSDEVLGESFVPLDEFAELAPTQPYAASKATAEMILRCYRQTYGLNVTIVRSCNLVGVQTGAPKLIPTAVKRLCDHLPVPVFGDGGYVREWLAVEDLCDAIKLVVLDDLRGELYHCSSGVHLSVTDVIGLVAQGLGVTPEWRYVADRLVHDRCYSMDSAKLRAHGWSPRHNVPGAIRSAASRLAENYTADLPRVHR